MELNPYEPPVVATPTLVDEQLAASPSPRRPIGIWILAGLHLLAGVLFLTGIGFIIRQLVKGEPSQLAAIMWFVAATFALFSVLALATSLGLWLGARWAWWLTAFYYVWSVLAVVAETFLFVCRGAFDEDVATLVLPELIKLAIHAIILVYLFKGTVRDFFCLRSLRMANALMLLSAIAAIVIAATFALGYLQSPVVP